MTFEEVEKEWREDCQINEENLLEAASRIPVLHNKYYVWYARERRAYKKLEIENERLRELKEDYYHGRMTKEDLDKYKWAPFQLTLSRTEVDRRIQSDKQLVKHNLALYEQGELVDYLKSIVDQINQRNWIIKSIIDWKKFTQGY